MRRAVVIGLAWSTLLAAAPAWASQPRAALRPSPLLARGADAEQRDAERLFRKELLEARERLRNEQGRFYWIGPALLLAAGTYFIVSADPTSSLSGAATTMGMAFIGGAIGVSALIVIRRADLADRIRRLDQNLEDLDRTRRRHRDGTLAGTTIGVRLEFAL